MYGPPSSDNVNILAIEYIQSISNITGSSSYPFLTSSPHTQPPPPPRDNPYSVFYHLISSAYSRISYKRNHTEYILLCLASLSPRFGDESLLFLYQEFIPSYSWEVFRFMHTPQNIWDILQCVLNTILITFRNASLIFLNTNLTIFVDIFNTLS